MVNIITEFKAALASHRQASAEIRQNKAKIHVLQRQLHDLKCGVVCEARPQ